MTKQIETQVIIYKTWWFWTIIGVLFLALITSFSDNTCNCPETYKEEYETCQADTIKSAKLYADYIVALHDYCELDITNNICIASQSTFEIYGLN